MPDDNPTEYTPRKQGAGARGSYGKGRRRRAEIVDAAVRVFSKSGYQNAAIATVAAEVGLTLPGLLHHFPSKTDLLLAVLEQRDEVAADMLPREGAGWRPFLASLVEIVRYNQTIPGVIRAFALLSVESLSADHPAADWFAERSQKTHAMIADTLRSGQADGTFDPACDADHVGFEIIAMMDGLQEQWLRSGEMLDMAGIFEAYVDRLVHQHGR
ncbi:MAG: TetR family transcriptional regulator [Rhizobiaceae bacterium]|nr:TetR family transcriptional regulator [Rhizobiaceae bacterium]|tara:strand:+ start:185 stop:826 length:642 start_codon:yes stop_codon:yes gene_type:complete